MVYWNVLKCFIRLITWIFSRVFFNDVSLEFVAVARTVSGESAFGTELQIVAFLLAGLHGLVVGWFYNRHLKKKAR